MSTENHQPSYTAANGLDALIARLVTEQDPDAVEERPIFPGAVTTIRAPRPLAALAQAIRLREIAAGIARRLACQARGDSATWQQVAQAANIRPDTEAWQRAEAAFDWAAGPGPPAGWSWSARVSWRCNTCQQPVTDRGPYDPHPDEQETGHTDNCPRHHADLAAWQAQRDRENEQETEDGND